MKIGNLDIGQRLLVAPMAEVTDASFRAIAKKHGAGLTFTQMVSAQGIIKNNFESLRLLSFARNEKPIGVQVLGNDPGILAEAVKEIKKFNADVIDLNCGCPVDKVTKVNMGSKLLQDTQLLGKLVRSMVDAAGDTPISVKVRLGRDRQNVNIVENAKIIEDNGASLLTIHARARVDKYDTDPDWNWIKKAKESVKIPIVGNGSVFTPEDAVKMKNETGCDSVMIARGALGNPFLFSRFNSLIETGSDPGNPGTDALLETVILHLDLLKREFGELAALPKAKKNVIWYFQFYIGINDLLNRIFAVDNYSRLYELVREHVHKISSNEHPEEDLAEIEKRFKKKVLFWLEEEVSEACSL